MNHRIVVLTIACGLGSPSVAAAQPFGWFSGSSGLEVVNLATGTTVLSANAPAGIELGDGAIDSVSGHYLAVTNIGTFRVSLSTQALEPGVLPYAGNKLRVSPNGETLLLCSGSVSSECRWIRRSDDTILAAFSVVVEAGFVSDSTLVVLTRQSLFSGARTLRRFTSANPATPLWTIDPGSDRDVTLIVGSPRLVLRTFDPTLGSHFKVFETSSGNSAGEISAGSANATTVAGTHLYFFYTAPNGRQRLARYSLETLTPELDIEVVSTLIISIQALHASADGRRLYAQKSLLGGRIPIAQLETYDAESLQILHYRSASTSRFQLTVSPDAICPFTVTPGQFAGGALQAPARGGLVELRVDTERRCGPWTVDVSSQTQHAALLGPTTRIGPATVHVAAAPNTNSFSPSTGVVVAGILYGITHASELSAPFPPVDIRVRVDGQTPTVTWSVNDGPLVTGFQLFAATADGASPVIARLPGTARSWSPGALPTGNYAVQMRATNPWTDRAPMTVPQFFGIGATQVPAVPTNLRADVRGSYVRLSWDAPPAPPLASRYLLEVGSPGELRSIIAQTPDTTPEYIVANVPARTWSIAVRAVNDAGTSEPSNAIAIAATPCIGPPGSPRNFSAVVTGNIVTLSWDVPASGADAFIVEAGSIVGASDLARLTLPASTTRLDAPAPSGAYALRVRGVNQCGDGAASNERVIYVR